MAINRYPQAANSDLVCREVDGNLLVLDSSNEQVHELNVTAAHIWKRCDGKTNMEDIASDFSRVFEIPLEKAVEDVEHVISNLLEKGLLTLDPPASA